MADHEHYCALYASKEEPHIHGILQSLSESVKHLEEAQARQASEGEDVTALAKARSPLHRLISSTNRRMHKGFPEMLAYIREKPEYIASMEFVPLYYSAGDDLLHLLRGVCSILEVDVLHARFLQADSPTRPSSFSGSCRLRVPLREATGLPFTLLHLCV